MEKDFDRIEKISRKIFLPLIKDKDDFIDFLSKSIKKITFIFESGNNIVASDEEDLDIVFLQLKSKIPLWLSETTHSGPFYPRDFLKAILKSNAMLNYIQRFDKNKIDPEEFGLMNANQLKNFLLQRIDSEDELDGLKFKPNSMKLFDGMPLDVYTTVISSSKDLMTRLYLKFFVSKNLSEAFFKINFISIHPDYNQHIEKGEKTNE